MKTVLKCSEEEIKRIVSFYRDYYKETNNQTVLFMASTEFVTVTIYRTNKVQFQGKDAVEEYNMWVTMLGHQVKPETTTSVQQKHHNYNEVAIGSDEVGTGDFFGPITVCAAYVGSEDIAFLKTLGINDSKKLSDEYILQIGEQLKNTMRFSLLTLHNEKFNQLFQQGFNMNKMKAYLHNQAIIHLVNKLGFQPKVIIDQFAEKGLYYRYLKDEQNVFRDAEFYTKAEDKFLCVAVASILARYAFLKHFDQLSDSCGYPLLKGAGAKVDELASQIIKEKGEAFLQQIAKINFRTVDKAKELLK